MPPVQRVLTAEHQRPGDVLVPIPRQHDDNLLRQGPPDLPEEIQTQGRVTALTGKRGAIKAVEHGPQRIRHLPAAAHFQAHARLAHQTPLPANVLALL